MTEDAPQAHTDDAPNELRQGLGSDAQAAQVARAYMRDPLHVDTARARRIMDQYGHLVEHGAVSLRERQRFLKTIAMLDRNNIAFDRNQIQRERNAIMLRAVEKPSQNLILLPDYGLREASEDAVEE